MMVGNFKSKANVRGISNYVDLIVLTNKNFLRKQLSNFSPPSKVHVNEPLTHRW